MVCEKLCCVSEDTPPGSKCFCSLTTRVCIWSCLLVLFNVATLSVPWHVLHQDFSDFKSVPHAPCSVTVATGWFEEYCDTSCPVVAYQGGHFKPCPFGSTYEWRDTCIRCPDRQQLADVTLTLSLVALVMSVLVATTACVRHRAKRKSGLNASVFGMSCAFLGFCFTTVATLYFALRLPSAISNDQQYDPTVTSCVWGPCDRFWGSHSEPQPLFHLFAWWGPFGWCLNLLLWLLWVVCIYAFSFSVAAPMLDDAADTLTDGVPSDEFMTLPSTTTTTTSSAALGTSGKNALKASLLSTARGANYGSSDQYVVHGSGEHDVGGLRVSHAGAASPMEHDTAFVGSGLDGMHSAADDAYYDAQMLVGSQDSDSLGESDDPAGEPVVNDHGGTIVYDPFS